MDIPDQDDQDRHWPFLGDGQRLQGAALEHQQNIFSAHVGKILYLDGHFITRKCKYVLDFFYSLYKNIVFILYTIKVITTTNVLWYVK